MPDSNTTRKIERLVDSAQILFAQGEYNEAIETAREAADSGNPRAKYIIAQCLEKLGAKDNRRYELLEEAADSGFPAAMFLLGKAYLENQPERAINYFKEAANNGNPQASYELGRCFELGLGTKPNVHDAFRYYTEAYDRGYKLASARLAHFYKDGIITARDNVKYEELLIEGCQYGDSDSLFITALEFYSLPETSPGKESAELFLKAANAGSLSAKALLAQHVLFEWIPTGDKLKSKKDLLEAAESGDAYAVYILGECYAKGIKGVFNIDYRKSGDYFLQSAKSDKLKDAYYLSGLSYLKTDISLARQALIKGIENGCRKCAEAYVKDIISDSWMLTEKRRKTKEELKVLEQCAGLDVDRAYFEVGICYLEGWGIQADLQKAFKFFQAGADKSDVNSIFMLARCYYYGVGTTVDRQKAIKLLQNQINKYPKALLLCELANLSERQSMTDHANFVRLYNQAIELLASEDNATIAYVIISWSEKQDIYTKTINQLYPSYTEEGRNEIITWLKKIIDFGYTKGLVALAKYYDHFNQYKDKIIPLLKKAADSDDREAMYYLYVRTDNIKEKHRWLEESAKRGYSSAIIAAGLNYLDGRNGFEQNTGLGVEWLSKGVELGNYDAMYHLGAHYVKSTDSDKVTEGLALLKKCAHKNSNALCDLARYYYKHSYPNKEEAINWLTKAVCHYTINGFNFALCRHYKTKINRLKRSELLNVILYPFENLRDEIIVIFHELTDK